MSGFKHGGWNSPTWKSWQSMKARCSRPTLSNYPRYGGSGVKVCERWQSFPHFLEDMGERPAGKYLDRIDNARGYEPGNCRWSSPKEQARNRRSNVLLTFQGITQPLSAWAEECGINPETLQQRVRAGWPAERALDPSDGRK